MKRLLILGAGTAGTMAANRLAHVLNADKWHSWPTPSFKSGE